MNRQLQMASPLPPDTLRIREFLYSEELGRPFRMELELVSADHRIAFERLVGDRVTIGLARPDGGVRFFNGVVCEFWQADPLGRYARYRATVVPWLWFLTRTADCRIFQEQRVPDIIKSVFREYGFTEVRDELKGKYLPREFCVQYRETDFNFVSRLMEHEGIYYYWSHENGKHTLVLVDDATSHETFPGYARIPFRPPDEASTATEFISSWALRQQVQPSIVALTDFDPDKPGVSLHAKSSITRSHPGPSWEVFDYPGTHTELSEGERYARVRIEEMQGRFERATGSADVRGISAGFAFELERHPREEWNRSYLVTACEYRVREEAFETRSGGGEVPPPEVACHFRAMVATEPFRPSRLTPRPLVQGPQTAVVVGPKGEEIYVDEDGRVKVQFHWDRYGRRNERSSCWIRVSQGWAGPDWGAFHCPRIGQEVIVEFLEGNPDCPIVTGRVFNGRNHPPFRLPQNKTQSGIRTRSTPGGDVTRCNEIRFEDKMGEELLFVQAEKDRQVLVKNNNSESVAAIESLSVGGDRSKSVGRNESISIVKDRTSQIGNNDTLTVTGMRLEDIGTNKAVKAGQNVSVGAGLSVSITAGQAVQIKAGTAISLECGASQIQMTQAGLIRISGTVVMVAGAINADITAPITTVTGVALIQGGVLDVNAGMLNAQFGDEVVVRGSTVSIN